MADFIEQEAKFRIQSPQQMQQRLQRLGAVLVRERQHELNTRFDRADGSFKQEHRVLRLRVDQTARLTYKGPIQAGSQVSVRKEVELEVSDVEAAAAFLQSLDFQPAESYEKYRSTYTYQNLEIVIDELPYGYFVEIEGDDENTIRQTADALQLDWEKRCQISYLELFYRVNEKLGLQCAHLTFAGFPMSAAVTNALDAEAAD